MEFPDIQLNFYLRFTLQYHIVSQVIFSGTEFRTASPSQQEAEDYTNR